MYLAMGELEYTGFRGTERPEIHLEGSDLFFTLKRG